MGSKRIIYALLGYLFFNAVLVGGAVGTYQKRCGVMPNWKIDVEAFVFALPVALGYGMSADRASEKKCDSNP